MKEYKSDTEKMAEMQEKAITIRDYMKEPDTMRQLMAALPNWLRADRFIRLFYSAMMQNANLLDATKQSLLSCMIQAAQIGIEPVFGKAALIPYKREVQLQLMYKGLMEVARRYADIVITGHVVYEVDEFDIEWGDNEKLHHKPKFGPEREKSEKIGVYDIWKVGDTIRSRRFMTTSEVIFIRDTYSKAWEQKGKKSVWGKHENDMFLKTVIKGHCKMEPQCIEMERAITLDDRAELQKSQLGMGRIDELPMPSAFDFKGQFGDTEPEAPEEPKKQEPGPGAGPGPGPEKKPADVAKTIAAQSGIDEKVIVEYIDFIAKRQEKTRAWVEKNILESPESFIKAVKNRIATLKAEAEKAKGKGQPETGGVDAAHMKEFWNLRIGKGGKTGLKAYVSQHIERIYEVYSENVRGKLIEKFTGFYPGEAFPKPFKKPEETQETRPEDTQGKEETPETRPEDTPDTTHTDGIGGADGQPPFKNPFEEDGQEEGPGERGLTSTEQMGKDIREAKGEEVDLVARYDNSVESVMKFDKSGVEYTLADFEKFMMEMAHMEGITFNSFKADVMRRHQFPDYFDKFVARISGRGE